MNTFDPNNDLNHEMSGMASQNNPLLNAAHESGLVDAINQSNLENQRDGQFTNYEEQLLGFDPQQNISNPEEDEFNAFAEEVVVPAPKPKKKMNDSKKRISQEIEKRREEQYQKEQALIRAELAEREAKRLADENAMLILNHQKKKIEEEELEVSRRWAEAHETGDLAQLQYANKILNEISQEKSKNQRH